MYTDDKNAQVVLSLLKEFGIKKIVINPGTTNVPIARSVQNDEYFEVYSIVDERGAAYFAGGLAFASGEPVVISCTGATASRNYLSGLTEAYYRNLPVIALTSRHHTVSYEDLYPQLPDRSVSQNDVKRFSAQLPYVKDNEDLKKCIYLVNKALHAATTKGGGPVHIDLPVSPRYSFTTEKLPYFTRIQYFNAETIAPKLLAKQLAEKKVGIFLGSHKPFDDATLIAINRFVKKYDVPVFYDHTSCYTGENGILISVISDLRQTENLPDLIIDMGSICGDYSASRLFKAIDTWRISEDGVFHNRLAVEKLKIVFEMSERFFFESLSAAASPNAGSGYYRALQKECDQITVPSLPLSNTYISYMLSKSLPKNCILHISILNSLRNMDFFKVDPSILTSCNVGGFGIDGALSTALGQSMSDRSRLTFCLVGDLAFFYDMNALGVRHVSSNLRILLVNNGEGVEFRLNNILEEQWGSDTDSLIAAHGHNGSARAWAESQGFAYICADTKQDFDARLEEFVSSDCDHFDGKPAVFEVFTTVRSEQQALRRMRGANRPVKQPPAPDLRSTIADATPASVKKSVKKLLGR